MKFATSKADEKLVLLLKAFKENESMTILDIMNLLKCNRQSAYNYIHRFEAHGYTLNKSTIKKITYYTLANSRDNADSTMTYVPITGKHLNKFTIIKSLSVKPAKAYSLLNIKEFEFFYSSDRNRAHSEEFFTNSYFFKLLNEMVQNNDIIKTNYVYYLNTDKLPLYLSLNYDDLHKLGTLLSNIPYGSPDYAQLKSLKTKIDLLFGNIEPNDTSMNNYILYGTKQVEFESLSKSLQKLSGYNYANKVMDITYLTNSGNEASALFATGMIVYSVEKDTLYLLGKSYNAQPYDNIIIKVNSIKSITETDITHSHFNSKEFKNIHSEMFSISVDEPVKVVVEFANIFNIRDKVERLCRLRPNAAISNETADTFIYTDTIRGITDFANYLRRFGRAFTAIEPPELVEMIEFSVKRSLERYEQED